MAVPVTTVRGHSTAIPGLLWFDISLVADDRGWLQEKFHRTKLVAEGLPPDFQVVQNSVTRNRRGAVRGFHAEPWEKYVSVITGEAFGAYLDLRAGETFGTLVTLELSHEHAVFIPRGVANAYQSLTDDQFYLYSMNEHWTPEAYDRYAFVNLADTGLKVNWPIPLDEAILSDRDRIHPPLRDVGPLNLST
jgi:dTDP-4-dehydrorhamnose 3,5-epimerase